MSQKKNNKTVADLTADTIKNISLDYVVEELSRQQIMNKYNITERAYKTILERNSLRKRRDLYRRKVLDKSLDKCSLYQSKIMFKATQLLANHVDAVSILKQAEANKQLSSEEVRDIKSILETISKEKRLDQDKPTEIRDVKVTVEFPEDYTPLTDAKQPIEVQGEEVKKPEEPLKQIEEDDEEVISGL